MLIWGILNVTPDSFSDGGEYVTLEAAIAHARQMVADGACVIDVGGESTRPAGVAYGSGYSPVSEAEEIDRTIPVIENLLRAIDARISIDTSKAEVAKRAIKAGASIVNDVSTAHNADLLRVVAEARVEYVIMHNRQQGELSESNTRYGDVVDDVLAELSAGVERARVAGIAAEKIWIDPGLGFAKTALQSLELLRALPRFVATKHRVLLGASRKSFLDKIGQQCGLPEAASDQRLGGSIAAACVAADAGCQAVRVHDVAPTAQALAIYRSIME